MKKLLGILVLGLLWCNNSIAGNEGSGPIKFPPKFEERFKKYLNHITNEKDYKFVFAFHPDGANDWQAITSENDAKSYRIAEKKAIKACNKKAKKKGCKIFSKGAQIVWKWDSIPEVYYVLIDSADIFDYIDWKDVSVEIGTGAISLSKETKKKFEEYLTDYNSKVQGDSGYFAVSSDGKVSGDMFANTNETHVIEKVKALAVTECMYDNKGEKCYMYAINDEIVWK